jgi:hypothetical protein
MWPPSLQNHKPNKALFFINYPTKAEYDLKDKYHFMKHTLRQALCIASKKREGAPEKDTGTFFQPGVISGIWGGGGVPSSEVIF